MLFEYPAATYFGRALPKTKVYQHAKPPPAQRQALVAEVDKIVWRHKLSPQTLNLRPSRKVSEIQIFEVHAKGQDVANTVLACIDKAVNFPIIFEVRGPQGWRVTAAYKEQADAGANPSSNYFSSAWLPDASPRTPLPLALTFAGLYERLLEPLLPYPLRAGESLAAATTRFSEVARIETQIASVQQKLRREKQFNRKVAINADLRNLQNQLNSLLDQETP